MDVVFLDVRLWPFKNFTTFLLSFFLLNFLIVMQRISYRYRIFEQRCVLVNSSPFSAPLTTQPPQLSQHPSCFHIHVSLCSFPLSLASLFYYFWVSFSSIFFFTLTTLTPIYIHHKVESAPKK